jgi:RNA polymerase sigma-70 factor (ECF subfamily)
MGLMSFSAGFEGVLAAAQEGAEWAWELLIRDFSGSLFGFFRVRGADDPDDLVGEVFHDVARGIGRFSGDEAGVRSWAVGGARRRARG